MEILVGIVVIVAVFYVVRNLGTDPQPSTLSDGALVRRIEKECVWISNYHSMPAEEQQVERLKRAFALRRGYVKRLQNELAMRQMAAVVKAFHPDASSIAHRAVELRAEGNSKRMAQTMAQLEWGLQGLLTKHLKGEALHDQGEAAKTVLRAAEIVKAGLSETVAISLALREWSERAK